MTSLDSDRNRWEVGWNFFQWRSESSTLESDRKTLISDWTSLRFIISFFVIFQKVIKNLIGNPSGPRVLSAASPHNASLASDSVNYPPKPSKSAVFSHVSFFHLRPSTHPTAKEGFEMWCGALSKVKLPANYSFARVQTTNIIGPSSSWWPTYGSMPCSHHLPLAIGIWLAASKISPPWYTFRDFAMNLSQ